MKVLMAEDLQPVRDHLSGLLAEVGDVDLRFLWQEAKPLLQEVEEWRPDAVILDISMRGGMALAVLEEIKKQWPGTAVVISASVHHPYFRKAFLSLGADLFLDKSLDWDDLLAFLLSRKEAIAPAENRRGRDPERKVSL